jgi:hypothetical protein
LDAPTPADSTVPVGAASVPVRPAHAHHWVIEPPNGPFSLGRCRSCNEERRFPNSTESAEWATEAAPEPAVDGEVASLERALARDRGDFRLSDEAA